MQGAGRWAQARVAGVRTGVQGVLALCVSVGARAAGGRGAQALGRQTLGRAGRAGVRGRTDGRCRQLGAQAQGEGAHGSRQDERMRERAGARWLRYDTAALRCDTAALRCDTAGGAQPRHGQAAHDTATSARPVRAGWAS